MPPELENSKNILIYVCYHAGNGA